MSKMTEIIHGLHSTFLFDILHWYEVNLQIKLHTKKMAPKYLEIESLTENDRQDHSFHVSWL